MPFKEIITFFIFYLPLCLFSNKERCLLSWSGSTHYLILSFLFPLSLIRFCPSLKSFPPTGTVSFSPRLLPHTSVPPFSVSLSVSMLLPCLRLSLPLFAFNSWGHPGPLGSHPRMLSRLMSCRVAFWTEQAIKPGLYRHSNLNMYSVTATATPPKKMGDPQRFFSFSLERFYMEMEKSSLPLIGKCTACSANIIKLQATSSGHISVIITNNRVKRLAAFTGI